MATQKGSQPAGRAVKLRGHVYVHQHPFGGWVARTWPKPKPVNMSNGQWLGMQQLSWAAYITKHAQTWEIESAKDQTVNSGYTWKDYYIAALYGRGVNVNFEDGTIWRSARVMASEVQLLLDSITNIPGTILYRDLTGWTYLLKGADKQVLTALDSEVGPKWQDPPTPVGATGESYTYIMPALSAETDAQSSIGEVFVSDVDITIWNATFAIGGTLTGSYKIGIAPFDTTTQKITAAPTYGVDRSLTTAGSAKWINSQFTNPISISAGQNFLVFVVRTDVAGIGPLNVYFTTTSVAAPYFNHVVRSSISRKLASNNPTTADTWSSVNGYYSLAFGYSPVTEI